MRLAEFAAALDSPLCEKLAPELFALKPKVVATIEKYRHGCQPCQQANRQAEFALLEVALMNVTVTHPEVAEILPHLIATGKAAP